MIPHTETEDDMPLHLLIVDDDEVSREVMVMLAEEEGYVCMGVDSGDAALAWLRADDTRYPDAVLTDLQMPGVTGDALATALRALCMGRNATGTILLAMSGSLPHRATIQNFDGFLQKPFSMADLTNALASRTREVAPAPSNFDGAKVLDETTYGQLKKTMGEEQLGELFAMFLADAEKRLAKMQVAINDDDGTSYRSAAHAIKGGCGMVGATELHRLAKEMEEQGLDDGSLDSLAGFVLAMERLKRILLAQAS